MTTNGPGMGHKRWNVEGKTEKFDVVGFVMDFESGELSTEAIIEGFQKLIDSGIVWQLQGNYGRTAARLIEAGRCTPASEGGR